MNQSDLRIPYRVLSAMPAHLQYLGDRCRCDVEVIRDGEETILRQTFTDEEVKDSERFSPREMRAAFLGISSESDAVRFLRKCGPFREEVFETTMAHIPEWQEFFRHWILSSSEPGPYQGPQLWMPVDDMPSDEDGRIGGVLKWSIFIAPGEELLEAVVDCESALEVIGATIALDLLEGAKFEACGWCKTLFEVTKQNGRKFCSQECAHRAGQKRRRAEAKKGKEHEKPQAKRRKTKGKT